MKEKRVLVSGGSGFIGSHLVRMLLDIGAEVSVIVKYKSIIDNPRLSSVWDNLIIYEADLRNVDSLRQFINKKYDYIFHLAAYNHVGDSFLHVNESLHSNAIGTANFLEFAPEYEKFLYMSSSEVYGFQESVPFNENFIPFPISPYSVGKLAGELYSKMKGHQTGNQIICVRAFNTFGPYQSERAIIPELIIKCLRGIPIATTKGKQTREFNYVINIVDGVIKAMTTEPSIKNVVNIGSNIEISIKELTKLIHKLTKSKSDLRIGALPDRPTEIWRMSADNKKAKEILNWSPRISFDEGLKKTIDWYKKYIEIYYSKHSLLNQL